MLSFHTVPEFQIFPQLQCCRSATRGCVFLKSDKYTIADVAKKAGVSPSTISRVLNNRAGVGPELRQRVLEFINELDYKPNTLARSLIKGRINIIALIFGDVRNPFYADLAFHIQKILNENGYMVMVFNSEYETEKEIEFIDLACQFNFAGLILITAQSVELQEKLKQVELPVVLVNRILGDYTGDMVFMDNFQAGYIATKHLIDLGHKSFAFLSGHIASSSVKQRYEGFSQVLKNYQIPFDEKRHFFNGDLKLESGYAVGKIYVENLAELPSAIVVSNDMMALGFIGYCREHNVQIPEMLSVVSFDNIIFASLHDIRLTAIDQQVQKMSEHAARLILRRIEDPEAEPERIILEPKLIVRGTTAPYNPDRLKNR